MPELDTDTLLRKLDPTTAEQFTGAASSEEARELFRSLRSEPKRFEVSSDVVARKRSALRPFGAVALVAAAATFAVVGFVGGKSTTTVEPSEDVAAWSDIDLVPDGSSLPGTSWHLSRYSFEDADGELKTGSMSPLDDGFGGVVLTFEEPGDDSDAAKPPPFSLIKPGEDWLSIRLDGEAIVGTYELTDGVLHIEPIVTLNVLIVTGIEHSPGLWDAARVLFADQEADLSFNSSKLRMSDAATSLEFSADAAR